MSLEQGKMFYRMDVYLLNKIYSAYSQATENQMSIGKCIDEAFKDVPQDKKIKHLSLFLFPEFMDMTEEELHMRARTFFSTFTDEPELIDNLDLTTTKAKDILFFRKQICVWSMKNIKYISSIMFNNLNNPDDEVFLIHFTTILIKVYNRAAFSNKSPDNIFKKLYKRAPPAGWLDLTSFTNERIHNKAIELLRKEDHEFFMFNETFEKYLPPWFWQYDAKNLSRMNEYLESYKKQDFYERLLYHYKRRMRVYKKNKSKLGEAVTRSNWYNLMYKKTHFLSIANSDVMDFDIKNLNKYKKEYTKKLGFKPPNDGRNEVREIVVDCFDGISSEEEQKLSKELRTILCIGLESPLYLEGIDLYQISNDFPVAADRIGYLNTFPTYQRACMMIMVIELYYEELYLAERRNYINFWEAKGYTEFNDEIKKEWDGDDETALEYFNEHKKLYPFLYAGRINKNPEEDEYLKELNSDIDEEELIPPLSSKDNPFNVPGFFEKFNKDMKEYFNEENLSEKDKNKKGKKKAKEDKDL
jgi:hypothetical protein